MLFSVKCLLFKQKALRNMGKLTDDGKWLQENLNELIEDSPESDTKREQKRLTDLLSKFSELQPNLNKVADKSTVFSKAYDFRDTLEKRNNWLDETQRLVNDEPSIDGLEDARGYLQEHKVSIHQIIKPHLMWITVVKALWRSGKIHGEGVPFISAIQSNTLII